MKFSQIVNYILSKRRRKKLSIIDSRGVIALSDSLKHNFKIEDSQKSIEISFYNLPIRFAINEITWEPKNLSSETEEMWLIKLHSFDWLNDYNSTAFSLNQASYLILDWLSKHGDEHSKVWEPYTLARRIVSWTKWLSANQVAPEITSIVKLSVSQQLKRLFIDLEYSNPGNHLIENIRGFLTGCCLLITSSQYFNNELEYQLEEIIDEAINQLNTQILKDGAHFERSPYYHYKVLEAVKDIKIQAINISKQGFLVPEILEKSKNLIKLCEEKTDKMTEWLEKMTFTNGEICQFNDSARIKGFKHSFEELTELLEDSGFFIKHNPDYSFILSCGSPSPAFLPAHSHCDVFSYELELKSNPIIIDSGCSGYDNETLRQMCRETEAHNLPMVQHQEQSDIWGRFNFGKRAKIIKRIFNKEDDTLELILEDQFRQILTRKIAFSKNSIAITDGLKKRRMEGCFISLLHLAPTIEPEISQEGDENIISCKMTNDSKFSIITKTNIRVSDYISFPDFGKSVGAKMLILSNKEAEELSYVIKW